MRNNVYIKYKAYFSLFLCKTGLTKFLTSKINLGNVKLGKHTSYFISKYFQRPFYLRSQVLGLL